MSDAQKKGSITLEGSTNEAGDLGQAIYWGLFPYMGWNALNSVTSEMRNPMRDLPKALITSIFTLLCLYTLVTVSIYSVVPMDEISNKVYLINFTQMLFGKVGAYIIILFCVVFAIFSVFNG